MSLSSGTSPPNSPGDSSPPSPPPAGVPRSVPSLRSLSDSASPLPAPLVSLNAARRPEKASTNTFSGGMPKEMQARLAAFHASRNVGLTSPTSTMGTCKGSMGPGSRGGTMGPGMVRPSGPSNWSSAPVIPGRTKPKQSVADRRGLKLPGGLPPVLPGADDPKLQNGQPAPQGSLFNKYANYIDTTTGTLKFAGKAVIHGKGVNFSSGSSFSISLDEIDKVDELGKGNYGTVYKVIHRKPRRQQLQNRSSSPQISTSPSTPKAVAEDGEKSILSTPVQPNTTNVVMAMKEIRLELDEAKFAQIIMELDVLHKCRSPYIIEFYGAFFQEGAVYICMEYMDGGSIDKLYKDGVPEGVLRKITYATVQGLKTLKDDHNIIHRDVKPTNILINTNGEIKLCDFGVSGNLVASIAKTNIGCQSYMAPERIANGGVQAADTQGTGTYSVQSDIWSLGLSILECAMGCYPYPPETYNNIFSQLSAIVDGQPPDLPKEGFSAEAHNFVRGCLNKIPNLRPTYAMLLSHAWISDLAKPSTITEVEDEDTSDETPHMTGRYDKEVADWVAEALEKRNTRIREGGKADADKPALHAAPLDAVSSPANDAAPGLPEKLEAMQLNGAEPSVA
ncbi:kinase-like protein [Terfezia boudieri ATCC MYA-4762]|uniref:mitogen-activated protein kinase kinase n=1 Tax=Terfezia boudieri ATCC MYA-4762 TaxID=1051890 RepID=A0A3N4LRE3_9PEZI|nr:kinase-like protein [Terfezia boudieri ATCC MYA-4762]